MDKGHLKRGALIIEAGTQVNSTQIRDGFGRELRVMRGKAPMALFNHLGDFGRTFQKGTSSSIEAPFRA